MTDFKKILSGPIPSLSTPFAQDESVDFAMLDRMVDRYIDWGYRCLMLTAGDSNYACLSDKEIMDVTFRVLERAQNRASVIVADRYFGKPEAIRFAKETARRGALVYMALPPDWGHSTTPETLANHYRQLSEYAPIMVVTNIFAPRGAAFGLDVIRRISEMEQVVAVKDDMCGAFGREMTALIGKTKAVISGGQKQNHLDVHPYGASGYLTTFGRFYPPVARRYWNAVTSGDYSTAVDIINTYDTPYFKLISSFKGGFNAGIYGTLELFGLASRCRRSPYATLDDAELEKLRNFFGKLNIPIE